MTKSHTYPVVGSHFRPPAKGLLASFGKGQRLYLSPEPENPYDVNAIKVFVLTSDIPSDKIGCDTLDTECGGYGWTHKAIFEESQFHLGYIPKEIALVLASSPSFKIDGVIPGTLGFSSDPKKPYTVTFDL